LRSNKRGDTKWIFISWSWCFAIDM
jgi:hypothetical protein